MASTSDAAVRAISLWLDTVPGSLDPRPALDTDLDVDVAIMGAGYTGLWTAYYLARADPSLRIAVLEKYVAGYGASGRNGGWCSALFAASRAKLARESGRDAAIAMHLAMIATVDEVGAVAAAEGMDIEFAKGGTLTLARTQAQAARLHQALAADREWGIGPEDYRWLEPAESRSIIDAGSCIGAAYTPHCASINPARLVRGLAEAVCRRGVTIYEQSPVVAIAPGVVAAPGGRLRARFIVRATEGYTPTLPGRRRDLAPVYSLMIATEPLPTAFWDQVGWRRRETLTDGRHLIIYAQRTADDRIAFGGRGAPYHFGSRVRPGFDLDHGVFAALRRSLGELFPTAGDAAITHKWGGPLGVPRDWFSSVGLDRATGLAWAGGYVGDGVGTANLAGRTLADLITGQESELTALPWVGHRSPRWEPEPARWLGINASRAVMASADGVEARTGKPARRAEFLHRWLGG